MRAKWVRMPFCVFFCFTPFAFTIVTFILLIVYGTRSDVDNLPPALVKLLPAGNCLCPSSVDFQCATCIDCAAVTANETRKPLNTWAYQYGRDDENLALDTDQCNVAFPGFFEDIDRAVKTRKRRPIRKEELEMEMYDGMMRAMIYDGELYVISVQCMGEDHRKKVIATLQSIHRAITPIPDRRELPNIEFVFTIEDMANEPEHPLWVLTRRIGDEQLWLMPDFGFWSWEIDGIGPYSQVAEEIVEREAWEPWAAKEKQLVWRGKLSFAPRLRRALLDASKDKPWSDVRPLQWFQKESMERDFVTSAEQCKYMFIAHAEGRSYSASLKYRLACRSVIIAHKLQWIQNYHYLLTPSGPNQNFVEVERDFSDLDAKMQALLDYPADARRIADNAVHTFRERYLTPAAEACYWRALVRGWGEVSFRPGLFEKIPGADEGSRPGVVGSPVKGRKRGVRFESFVLLESKQQMRYP